MRSIVRAMMGLFVGVAIASAPSIGTAAAIPFHTNGTPRFSATVPDGFQAARVERGTGVFAMFRRPADNVLVVFTQLAGPLPRGNHDPDVWQAAHQADPFHFSDTTQTFHALGFDVDGARGIADTDGHRVVRFAALVPTEGRGIVVSSIAPAEHEREAREALTRILESMHGRSSWQSTAQRVVSVVSQTGLAVALAICVLYALLLAVYLRGRPERAPIARGLLLATAGLGWMAFSAMWFAESGIASRAAGLLVAGLGLIMIAQGLGIVRRRSA